MLSQNKIEVEKNEVTLANKSKAIVDDDDEENMAIEEEVKSNEVRTPKPSVGEHQIRKVQKEMPYPNKEIVEQPPQTNFKAQVRQLLSPPDPYVA